MGSTSSLRFAPLAALVAVVSLTVACDRDNPGDGDGGGDGIVACDDGFDPDGDGYGQGCEAGPDCDESNAAIHENCCEMGIPALGCPCDPAVNTPVTCFEGTPEQMMTPPCMKGQRTCQASTSTWGECLGGVQPENETCDGVDNDCDGTPDDGVLTPCGNCVPGCNTSGNGDGTPFPIPPVMPLPPGIVDLDSDGVGLDMNGDLVLDEDSIEFHFLWIANDPQGTVSKLDTVTGKEVARYASVTHAAFVNADGGNIANVPAWNAGINRPSRTAVDFYGNVWVANRAFNNYPSATKILNDKADCIDRNGNGSIDTSTDVDGSGTIDINNPAEFLAEADECIAFTVALGSVVGAAGARALAIDAGIDPGDPGNAWVGLYSQKVFYQLNGKTGEMIRKVPVPVEPYGAAIDGVGRLWAPNGCCGAQAIMAFNVADGSMALGLTSQVGTSGGSYGIAVDQQNKVWFGGYPRSAAMRFDPDTMSWAEVQVPGYAGWGGRGIGPDGDGNVWMCMHNTAGGFSDGVVARINTATLTSTGAWDLGVTNTNTPVGCAVDFDGQVWAVNQDSSTASRLYIDPVSKEPAPHPLTGQMVDTFPTGPNPYTYSDFTGFGLRNVTRPSGEYVVVNEPCPMGQLAKWLSIAWDATVPAGTAVEISVRAGDDLAQIATWPSFGVWTVSPGDFQMPPGPVPDSRYLELTIRLISLDRVSTPIVHSYDLQWACPDDPVGKPSGRLSQK